MCLGGVFIRGHGRPQVLNIKAWWHTHHPNARDSRVRRSLGFKASLFYRVIPWVKKRKKHIGESIRKFRNVFMM